MVIAGCASVQESGGQKPPVENLDPVVDIISHKVAQTVREMSGDSIMYPRSIPIDGKWRTIPIEDWTSGFFPGILWNVSELTGDTSLRASAVRWTEGLTPLQYYAGTHDLGFMVYSSFGNGFHFTKDESYKEVMIQAARTLSTRYRPVVGCIKSWDNRIWPYPVIIDNMMNLELLFWASKNGGTRQMYDIAFSHAERTMQNHFRSDWSTYHVLSYDTTDGHVIWKGTVQGYSDSSCWSRGQAWAIYGFTMSYRFTRDKRFLTTAQHAADYFIERLPDDNIPYWDFQAPGIPDEPRDVSAAAIAASAMFELSGFVQDAGQRTKYYTAAVSILDALMRKPYFAEGSKESSILQYGVGNKPAGREVGTSLIYGDYYFIEAIMRLKRTRSNIADVHPF
jgi:unsaturated chondroitin disaccharide hydrolase